ncbi:hypothetical protein VP01_2019g1 [Puccinia sorghi]|uniref:N-acetyltransferase domain-containing protein n=1 Tax=Puccinia sorghi TaxID=27349 RepID=A0A0L6VB30_9BASI|nr:hypothetical protein VP01_2019g1 [Puccinia sorghi]
MVSSGWLSRSRAQPCDLGHNTQAFKRCESTREPRSTARGWLWCPTGMSIKEHVPQYHEWMSDQELRESTASELLTLQEEYDMCERWAQDHDSSPELTFIILARDSSPPSESDQPGNVPSDNLGQMIGDVNLFLSPDDEFSHSSSSSEAVHATSPCKGELEIMIASTKHRQLGLATEALQLFLSYIQLNSSTHVHPVLPHFPALSFFFVKISFNNTISQRLFETDHVGLSCNQKLGFEKKSTNTVFEEYEYHLNYPVPTLTIDEISVPKARVTDVIFSGQDTRPARLYHSKWKDSNPIEMTIVPFPVQKSSLHSYELPK